MAARGVTLDQVMEAAASALDAGLLRFTDGSLIGTGGFVDTANQRIVIQHVSTVITAESLEKVQIDSANGDKVALADVANLVPDFQPLIGDAVINDGPGIMLIVEKFPWANTLDVTRGVEVAMEELRPGLTGIEIDTTIFRPATFITVALDNLARALLVGSILVFVILVLFLFDWRTALISLVAIPLSLMAATLVLDLRGTTINTMVIAGLVISVGVVVDDAIIDIENIVRRLRQHRLAGSGRSTASIVLESSLEVRSAIIYATLIDVVAHRPRLLRRRPVWRLLPAARDLVRPGRARLAVRCPDRHAGDGLHPAPQRAGRAPRVARGANPAAGLLAVAGPDRPNGRDPHSRWSGRSASSESSSSPSSASRCCPTSRSATSSCTG